MKLLNKGFELSTRELNPEVSALIAGLRATIKIRLDNLKEIEIGKFVPKKTKGRPRS